MTGTTTPPTPGSTGGPRAWLSAVRLPDDPAARTLLFNALVSSIGTGMFLTGAALFYTRVIGLSSTQMATGLAIAGAVGLLATIPGGMITDRVGARRYVVTVHLVRAVSFCALAFVDSFAAFVLVLAVVAAADGSGPAANEAMVADIFVRAERVRRLALVHAARNVGMSVGAAVGALAVSAGSDAAFRSLVLLNAASFVVVALMVTRLKRFEHRVAREERAEGPEVEGPAERSRVSPRLIVLAAVSGGLLLSDSVLFVALPLWIAGGTSIPEAAIGVALIVNTLLTALIQVPITRLADTYARAVRLFVPGALLMAVAMAAYGAGALLGPILGFALVIVATVVLTVAENAQSAASWQIRYDLAPAGSRARFLSYFSLGEGLQSVYGPLAVTALAVTLGQPGWLLLGGLMVLIAGAIRLLAAWNETRYLHAEESS